MIQSLPQRHLLLHPQTTQCASSLPRETASPDDRLPTFGEVCSFIERDAAAAWDRLTPEQQRKIGALAVELAIVGGSTKFDLGWTLKQIDAADVRTDDLLQSFYEQSEPLWADFYGWRAQ
ncbi:hypothetical protein QIH87_14165 [Bradyrhizobium elkanii]|uniref:hypothetical protein n=1 Tax=Bradyrhizobium elkanii TaxID=29448 RepID=UPI00102057E0|nr:hypothetical protein [Bradyrhizobium elkanii]MCW2112496.1 hypothetical protein [Bradyrhizobium elkanii]MCW2199147.1 hypothetical protein [Bradyrhizobium elkanii]MCW2229300.1 hypothetical protein [Bradyrhizobium elkanii]NWL38092.1 hypothetical protein [Bradyrhizobium elkanii]RYM15743.1 hypothetical protein EWH13_38545 [Bradyrhizobium elkanii]